MDFTLLFPPIRKSESYNPFYKTPMFPPLGLALIGAVLEQNGYKVKIYDCEVSRISLIKLRNLIKKENPKAIGITASTSIFFQSRRTAKYLKMHFPDIPIIMGGPHITIFPNETLKQNPFIDFIVIGEGEKTSLELFDAIEKNKQNFSDIRGIGYRENGHIRITKSREYIKDIDELPIPARHLLPIKLYKPSERIVKRPPATHAIFSRGCPFRCGFCSKAIWGRTIRERSAEKVVEEILHLKEKYGFRDIVFADDTFTINKKRVLKICDYLIKNKIDIAWSCLTRVDCVDRELLIKMKASGCHQIGYGVESGNQEMLDLMKKDITLDQIRKVFQMTHEVKIDTRTFIMLGLPGETAEMAQKSIRFLKEIDPDFANIYIYTPYPGTELFEIAKERGEIKNFNWIDFDKFSPVYIPYGRTRSEIVKTYKQAFREFYLSLHYIKKRLKKIDNLYEIKKNLTLLYRLIKGITANPTLKYH
ncbi:MAG: B12-binding domain-containing radical SAM protein [Promethearchaeota archaeon]